ncbi:hypothetical protein ACF0H5_019306 [Mactra antiquata]
MPNITANGEVLYQDTGDLPAIIFITCMLSVFSVVGTTGNAFVLYVFSNKKDKNTSTVFILALASIDFVTCLIVIPFTIIVEFQYKKIDNDIMCKIYQFFITSNVPCSAFIMVAIAFDRYFCICRPWMKILDIKSAKRIIASLLIFALSLGLITSLAYGVYHRKANMNETDSQTDHYNDSVYSNTDTLASENIQSSWKTITFEENHVPDNCSISWNNANGYRRNYSCPETDSYNIIQDKTNDTNDSEDFVFTGYCYPTDILMPKDFRKIYQTFYASLFLVMFLIVFALYALILRSILNRRSKRLKSSFTVYNTKDEKKKRSSILCFLSSRRKNNPETMNMLPCSSELNNKRKLEKPIMNGSDSSLDPGSLATCITTTVPAYGQQHATNDNTNGHINVSPSESNEIIREENENTSLVDNESLTLNNDLDEANEMDKNASTPRSERTSNSSNFGKYLRRNDKREKNVNKTVLIQTDEMGVVTKTHHETFKVSPYNIYRKDTRKSVKEKHRIANIKTAGILFTVTLVFIIAFLPAWLMATKIIAKPNMIIFYMYFIYNVANPFIYAFFNQTFQKEMKTVLKCK